MPYDNLTTGIHRRNFSPQDVARDNGVSNHPKAHHRYLLGAEAQQIYSDCWAQPTCQRLSELRHGVTQSGTKTTATGSMECDWVRLVEVINHY